MVILFSDRKSKIKKEIIEILKKHNSNYISDNKVSSNNGKFTIISEYKITDLEISKGIAVFCDNTKRFINQKIPKGIIGICNENDNINLKILKNNNVPTVTCGINNKNTITFSSISKDYILVSIQRTIWANKIGEIEPVDIKIKLSKKYDTFSIMVSCTILLLNGIIPNNF